MGWQTTPYAAEFLAMAGAFLQRERARNTVLLTVAETLRERPDRYGAVPPADQGQDHNQDQDQDRSPLFGWWTSPAGHQGAGAGDGRASGRPPDAVGGAFLHTPPFPVLLSAMPAGAAAELAAGTLARRPLAGVNGNPAAADGFAAVWRERTGCRAEVHQRMRLYRLGELAWPDVPPAGAPRLAVAADAGQALAWFTAFAREAGAGAEDDQSAAVRDVLSYGGLTFWEADGAPVSMAGLTRQVAGMVRVGHVYTPPRLRRRGYGSAVTSAVSRAALSAGAQEVLLYTDLANPVSNSIYQRIGYRPVEDRVVVSFREI